MAYAKFIGELNSTLARSARDINNNFLPAGSKINLLPKTLAQAVWIDTSLSQTLDEFLKGVLLKSDLKSATGSSSGLISANDKAKLDTILSNKFVNVEGNVINVSENEVFFKELTSDTVFSLYQLPNDNVFRRVTVVLKNADRYKVSWPLFVKWLGNKVPVLTDDIEIVNFLIFNDSAYGYANKFIATTSTSEETNIENNSSAFRYKGSVESVENLPTTGNTEGDIYNVGSDLNGMNYIWNGEQWDSLGRVFQVANSLENTTSEKLVSEGLVVTALNAQNNTLTAKNSEQDNRLTAIETWKENVNQSVLDAVMAEVESRFSATIEYFVSTPPIGITEMAKGNTYNLATNAKSLLFNEPLPITFFVLDIPDLNIHEQAYPATDNAVTIPITVPADFAKTSVTATLYAVDSANHKSKPNVARILIGQAKVKAPVILFPEENAEPLNVASGFTVRTNEFTANIDDQHLYSSWKITTDSAGQNVVLTENNSSDLITHSFPLYQTNGVLEKNTDYYVHAMHIGKTASNSIWSTPRKFRVKDGVVSKNGRLLYRHPSDKGIVIEWHLGNELKKLFVYDDLSPSLAMLNTHANTVAFFNQFANCCSTRYEVCNTTVGRSNFSYRNKHHFNIRTLYGFNNANAIIGTANNSVQSGNGADDRLFNNGKNMTGSAANYAFKSSRVLCNRWIAKNNSYKTPLVSYARSINDISGIDNLDIPSIRELFVLLTEMNTDDPCLSKDGQSSFWANKKIARYLTSNVWYYFAYCYNGKAYPKHYPRIEYVAVDWKKGTGSCPAIGVYDFNGKAQALTISRGCNVPTNFNVAGQSFLVRDLTYVTNEQSV